MANLPPLTALRAFEAAARHLSFAQAADELAVTPAALSFQIKRLEEHLGASLFVRKNRAVVLTDAGRALSPYATAGMEALSQGWQAALRSTQVNRLTVTAGPGFTAKWLAPRLGGFSRAHPEVELRLSTSLAVLDFTRDGIDVGVRFGESALTGQFSERLMDEVVLPVAQPAIAARLTHPRDILGETIVHDDSLFFLSAKPDWTRWFRAAGVAVDGVPGPSFSQADHAVDMALEGGGVVLGRYSMMRGALRDGALVAPFPLALGMAAHYRIVTPEGQQDRPVVARFRDWLKACAAEPDPIREGLEIVMVP